MKLVFFKVWEDARIRSHTVFLSTSLKASLSDFQGTESFIPDIQSELISGYAESEQLHWSWLNVCRGK